MNWFSANILFVSQHSLGISNQRIWEEKIFIFRAECDSHALDVARQIGIRNQLEYEVSEFDRVKWVFDRVERVCEIQGNIIVDGVEVFSRFLKDSEVISLLTPFDD